MKNPQTTIAPTFLMHIISAIDGVNELLANDALLFFKILLGYEEALNKY